MKELYKSRKVEAEKFDPIPSAEDFEIIKGFLTSDDIKREDLFVYKVKLCDNLVDRDYERFTSDSLEKLKELFTGVVGIEDHNPQAHRAHSRIYKTEHIIEKSPEGEEGDTYEYVLAYVYTFNNEKNKQLIDEIKSGIKKEVSVGISNNKLTCSICGKDIHKDCDHIPGMEYNGKQCVGLIDGVDDVYEWSFVAVPAQRKAGVVKSIKLEEQKILKKEARTMGLKAAALKVIKSAGVAPEDAEELLEEIEKVDKPDEATKALEDENTKLKDDLEKLKKEVEEGRVRRVEERIDQIIDEMKPKNDKMRALARRAIEELIRVDTDGKLTDESERDIRNELESDEYRPLFEGSDEDKAKEVEGVGCGSSKGLQFTVRNPLAKSVQRNEKQETGVMGIHFVEK